MFKNTAVNKENAIPIQQYRVNVDIFECCMDTFWIKGHLTSQTKCYSDQLNVDLGLNVLTQLLAFLPPQSGWADKDLLCLVNAGGCGSVCVWRLSENIWHKQH